MPKARTTCVRCSMRRQKCDRQTPCGRCVANKEAHLCTTEWVNGYNADVHRRYPRKTSPNGPQSSAVSSNTSNGLESSQTTPSDISIWPSNPCALSALRQAYMNGRSRSFSTSSSLEANNTQPQEPTPSSNNLDFITYGRSDWGDANIGTLLASKDSYTYNKTLMGKCPIPAHSKQAEEDGTVGGFSPAARAVEVFHIRSLLPQKEQVQQMVDYHEKYMVYWSGGIYHGPSFRKELIAAYGQTGELDLPNLDWRWTALLFAILSSSIIGSPEETSALWGYSAVDKVRLARQWGQAAISCLLLGDFASKYHISSVQAVLVMHTSEHLVGSTKEWAVYQNAGIIIARGLGLHRLGPHPDDGKYTELSEEQKKALLDREMGRRIWIALASQDWLCSTSQGLYTIQRRHYTTIKPGYLDEETMAPIVDGTPTYAHVSNYLNDVAYLLVNYHDDMLDAQDIATKYHVVLKYDAKMRSMAADQLPTCLSNSTLFNLNWPRWVAWSRRMFQASWAHKIIMIHQAFLGRSFKSPQYTYSRWACVHSAKIIISELDHERESNEPQWWVKHAFVVTAGICLALDTFHRGEKDTELRENLIWIDKAIKTLERWPTSSVATHGNRLLNSLLQEYNKKFEASRPNPPSSASLPSLPDNIAPASIARAATESAEANTNAQSTIPEVTIPPDQWPPIGDMDMVGFEDLMDTLPMEAGFDNNMFFESMLSLANSQFY